MFTLHPRLAEDSLPLGDFPLSTCRLMNDMHYPWLVLVPRVPSIREVYELSVRDQQQLLRESSWVSEQLAKYFRAEKMNVAAIGNLVPQLHIHHSCATVMMPLGHSLFGVNTLQWLIPQRILRLCAKP